MGDVIVGPCGEQHWQMFAEPVAVFGHGNALLLIEHLREGEIFQFIETRVLDKATFACRDDAASGLNMTPQSAAVNPVKIDICCSKMCPQPAGLLVAQRAELIIAVFVPGVGIGLPVAHEGKLKHACSFC